MYQQQKKRSRHNRSVGAQRYSKLFLAAFVSWNLNTAEAFSKVATKKRSSILAFRHVDDVARHVVSAPWVAASQTMEISRAHSTKLSDDSPADVPDLPAWLSVPRHHLSETNLQRLQKSMSESFFTENESLKVMYAIEEAAAGDAQLVAGASEFLLLILETVELQGVNALVAAAFHYCASFTARRQAAQRLTHHPNVASFGTAVESLVKDIGRLKEMELLASRVMQNSEAARPDQHDADNLRKLLLSETADWRALAIRTVASLYRLRGIIAASNDPNRVRLTPEAVRTAREALTIYAPLASRLGMNKLKNELESTAFQILYQRQYGKVNALVQEFRRPFAGLTIGQSMDELMNQVQAEIITMFQDDPEFNKHVEHFAVTARVKQPYSLWKKMLRNGHDHILQVPDALALRIVLKAKTMEGEPAEVARARERALCYYAQKQCTHRWEPLPDNPRFKDYIERPKANGYQSLHYTAMAEYAGENWNMEIQVRSSEMHSVAEYGLASHWDYKLQNKNRKSPTLEVKIEDDIDRSSQAYLRKVQQWHWDEVGAQHEPVRGILEESHHPNSLRADHLRKRSEHFEPYIRALTAARSDLARDFVFVFLKQNTAESRVLALPSGSCVVDAIRECEKSFGVSLWKSHYYDLNGAAATVSRRLSNGDVLTV
uniref:RelA/SpoT domain-containing protein n=1 Tax=Amphora coffeiformis TaxID=265554 RepID=A0A6S8J2A1_9STRA